LVLVIYRDGIHVQVLAMW